MFSAAARRRNSLSSDAVGGRRGRGGRPKGRPRWRGTSGLNSKADAHVEAGVGGAVAAGSCAGVKGEVCWARGRRAPVLALGAPSSSLLEEERSGARACTRGWWPGVAASPTPGLAAWLAPMPASPPPSSAVPGVAGLQLALLRALCSGVDPGWKLTPRRAGALGLVPEGDIVRVS